jgi:hypothetical protein
MLYACTHPNRFGSERKMKAFTAGVVFLPYFLLMMGDFPWPISEKV